ncbi:thioredoxin-like protein [Conidiobolus coronatus NRRL 28638]|uniref:Glutathione S-transferase kappa n=1 Tax=Conidiobolus coronatus (strain ATCC 28846 / CBS 209.66 / NRRL 28638) TaxID=796925 RepID=A0A137PIY2_CONC2|nr:thioredoxin-like protein [Conidiobolus coronatus NRRL 28638]|eukprot:KXN74953.1 thioredoxin-like protein [Conidiobolus coronatus NRRL 28638]
MTSTIKLYYDIASFYSALAIFRIARRIRDKSFKLKFELKPIVLGGVFKAQGAPPPPADKLKYMSQDLDRLAKELGYPHFYNTHFPFSSALANRVILYLNTNESKFNNSEPEVPLAIRFSEKAFEATYVNDVDPSKSENLVKILKTVLPDADAEAIIKEANSQKYKDLLKAYTNEAIEDGVFGAPSFICPDGELFWGNDRLISAYKWADKVIKAKL